MSISIISYWNFFLLPEIFFLFFLCFSLILVIFYFNSYYILFKEFYSLILVFLFILLLLYGNIISIEGYNFSYNLYNNFIIIDFFNTSIKMIIVFIIFIIFLVSFNYFEFMKVNSFEFFILFFLSLFGLVFILNSYNLTIFYISVELQSLCFYVLTSTRRGSIYSLESGLKYFIIGSFSSCILLFGISFLYGFTGLLGLNDLSLLLNHISYDNVFFLIGVSLAIMLVSLSFCFKLYVAPFHLWIQDIYQHSLTPVTMYFALVPSYVYLCFMFRLFYFSFEVFAWLWEFIFSFCGFCSIILGSLGGLFQKKIKRLIAYSSINNFGYLLLMFIYCDVNSVSNIFTYYFVYVISTIIIFTFLVSVIKKNKDYACYIDSLDDLKGYGRYNGYVAFFLSVSLFSLSGVPPMAGFYAKLFVFLHLYDHGNYFLLLILILSSLISSFYYIRVVNLMFFKPFDYSYTYTNPNYLQASVMFWLTFFLILFMFKSNYITVISDLIAFSLF